MNIKKIKGIDKNVFATISHNEYKNVLLNKNHIRHPMKKIQSKKHRKGTLKSTKFHCLVLITIDMMY